MKIQQINEHRIAVPADMQVRKLERSWIRSVRVSSTSQS
jgi:hypothetical protein